MMVARLHARALRAAAPQESLTSIIEIMQCGMPPDRQSQDPLPSTPPVGTQHPPPPPPKPLIPFDKEIIRKYSKAPRYSLYCQSTRNNTITTLVSHQFRPIIAFSGGTCGFKKVARSTYEAGYQCAVRMFKAIREMDEKSHFELDLYFKGFGQGRDAMQRALMTSEGDKVRQLVVSITDRTPIKIGGTRSKKARRL